jgi:hypothetical protein
MVSDDNFSIGLEILSGKDQQILQNTANQMGFAFVAMQIISIHSDILVGHSLPPSFISPNIVHPCGINVLILFRIYCWLCVHLDRYIKHVKLNVDLDSHDSLIRSRSETLVKQQISWAAHLGILRVMFLGEGANFSRMIRHSIKYTKAVLRISLNEWPAWNRARMACNHNAVFQNNISDFL